VGDVTRKLWTCIRFESRLRNLLFWLRFSRCFPQSLQENSGEVPWLGRNRFFNIHLTTRCCIILIYYQHHYIKNTQKPVLHKISRKLQFCLILESIPACDEQRKVWRCGGCPLWTPVERVIAERSSARVLQRTSSGMWKNRLKMLRRPSKLIMGTNKRSL
jgi:hypothetical protein